MAETQRNIAAIEKRDVAPANDLPSMLEQLVSDAD